MQRAVQSFRHLFSVFSDRCAQPALAEVRAKGQLGDAQTGEFIWSNVRM
jgi:hypothetical protein